VVYPLQSQRLGRISHRRDHPTGNYAWDTALAVSPKDSRYKKLVGQTVILPILDREIPVISDSYVDPEFGTGVVKVSPAHDPMTSRWARRHDLPEINILNTDGTLNENAGKYKGLDRYEGRKVLVADLEPGNCWRRSRITSWRPGPAIAVTRSWNRTCRCSGS